MTIKYNEAWNSLYRLASSNVLRIGEGAVDENGDKRYSTLSKNVEGTYVTDLQSILNTFDSSVDVDGAFGKGSSKALNDVLGVNTLEFDVKLADLAVELITKIREEKPVEAPVVPSEEASTDTVKDLLWENSDERLGGWLRTAILAKYVFTPGRIPHYCQGDPVWCTVKQKDGSTRQRILGVKRTLKGAGCAVTSTSMLLDYLTGEAVRVFPSQLDAWLDDNGGYSGDSLIWGKPCNFAKELGLSLKHNRIEKSHDELHSIACDLVQEGQYPLLRVKYTHKETYRPFDHFVLAVGIAQDNSLMFNDPGTVKGNCYENENHNSISSGRYKLIALDYYENTAKLAA